jgi:hypothetical protein
MSFDAQAFLSAAIHGALDTKTIPCPVGEYMGIIDKVAPRQWTSKDGTQSGIALDVFWLIEDAGVRQLLGRETVLVKQGIMLDLTPQGSIDMRKGFNIGLGRLREAVGKNDSDTPFSFAELPGLCAKVNITHRMDKEETYAEVRGVAKL